MTLEIPDSPKIYTTVYSDFKGVDYTNDPTNVWKKRSPSGINMLPDDAGRPFKRHGWEKKITEEQIEALIGDYEIQKCAYFELGGVDYIVIFCDTGVLLYDGTLSVLTQDTDCCASYNRCFFFEGDGKSAFYIYGNFRMWRYDGTFSEITDLYVPKVLISTEASGVGTVYEGYNMLGNKAIVQYKENALFHCTTSGDLVLSVEKETFVSVLSDAGEYKFTYDTDHWEYNGATITLSTYGIDILGGTPKDKDVILVISAFGTLLPTNVSQQQYTEVEVYASTGIQFDTPLEVIQSSGTLADGTAMLHTDETTYPPEDRRAWIQFYKQYLPLNDSEEDCISVSFPVSEVTTTSYTDVEKVADASIKE